MKLSALAAHCQTQHRLAPGAILVTVRGERLKPDGNVWAYGEQARIEIARENGTITATACHHLLSTESAINALESVFGVKFIIEGGEAE